MVNHTSKVYEAQSAQTAGFQAALHGGANTGSSLFIINLCASIAPISAANRHLPGLENYRLYQVARVEDGRTRHRLRLGFFDSESHAQGVLAIVRQHYPTAFVACLGEEDHRFTRGYRPGDSVESAATVSRPTIAIVSNDDIGARAQPPQSRPASQIDSAPQVMAVPTTAAARPQTHAVAQSRCGTGDGTPASSVHAAAGDAASAASTVALSDVAPTRTVRPSVEQPALDPSSSAARKALVAPSDVVAAIAAAIDEAPNAGAATAYRPAATAARMATEPEIIELTWEPSPEDAADAPAARSMSVFTDLPPASAARSELVAVTLLPGQQPLSAAIGTWPDRDPGDALAPPHAGGRDRSVWDRPVQPLLDPGFSDPPPTTPQPVRGGPAQPFHVGQHVDFGDIDISLQSDPHDAACASPPATTRSTPAPAAAHAPTRLSAPPVAVAARASGPAGKSAAVTLLPAANTKAVTPRLPRSNPPELDSTQTIRALTLAELEDEQLEKWFSIQLAASEQAVNLDAMPHLDIFEAYRLYSVAGTIDGRIVHSLRLGFFKEEVSAEAVGGYLKTFFTAPAVLRVSEAEYSRFKEPRARPRSTMQEAKVIDLGQARPPSGHIPVVTMEVPTPSRDPRTIESFAAHAPPSPDTDTERSFDPRNTGSLQSGATGAFKAGSGAPTKPAARTAAKAATAARRYAPVSDAKVGTKGGRAGTTGRHKAIAPRSLSEELLEEARAVQLSESAIRRLPRNSSLLSRLVGKLTR